MAKKYDLKLKGTVGYWNFNKHTVDSLLDSMKDKEVHVLIDSLGGLVSDALSISSAFADHGNVHVHYRGMNASAATISSMGAKHISIDASALYLVHKCSNIVFEWAALNADQLIEKAEEYKKAASDLEKIDLVIASMYAKRCKKSVQELHDLMRENKWLTAQEALEWGFVDEVLDSEEKVTLTASVATAMASEGMPVPDMDVEADGFINRLVMMIQKMFSASKGSTVTADDNQDAPIAQAADAPEKKESESPDSNQSNQSPVMKKVFLMVAAVLAAASQAALPEEADKDGKYSVDGAQLDAIEAALATAKTEKEALETAKADLQSQLDAANARITELEAQPAAKNEHVVETGHEAPHGDSPLDTMQANIAEARHMLGKD